MQWYIFDRKHLAPATLSMEGGRLPWPVRAALPHKKGHAKNKKAIKCNGEALTCGLHGFLIQ
jgi:hypothetical protein